MELECFLHKWLLCDGHGWISSLFLHFCSPLYSIEVMEEAIEPLSQSLSMFLLDALLSIGNDSTEHTDPALEVTLIGQSNDYMDTQDGKKLYPVHLTHYTGSLTSVTLPLQIWHCLPQWPKKVSILDNRSSDQLKMTETEMFNTIFFTKQNNIIVCPFHTWSTVF